MMNSDIRDQAYQFFIEEATELLQIIEDGLLSLQTEKSPAKVHEIMRAAHSIKGGAASVGLNAIKEIAHRNEDFFKALYGDEVEINSVLEQALLKGFDCLRDPLIEQIETGFHDAEAALATAEPVFTELETLLGDSLAHKDDYIPSSSDLGVDIATELFKTDVAEELERLAQVLQSHQSEEVTGELRATAEVFAGFAELLNLPGFGEIATNTLKALDIHPEASLNIAHIALTDFSNAREQVLNGDRHLGGSCSDALLAYCKEPEKQIVSTTEKQLSSSILDPDIQDQAYQFFIEEATELLQIIEDGLLTLRTDKSPAKIHQIMRAAHSIKGGAASLGLNAIKEIAHRNEDFFKALYGDEVKINEDLEQLLLQGFDCLRDPLMRQIETGGYNAEAALANAEPIFTQLETLLGDALAHKDDYIPSSSDLGVDMATELFKTDVAEELKRLAEVIQSPEGNQLAGELRATAEVFAGFAELLNLPGFGEIATNTLKALDIHPEATLEIAQLALTDFSNAREQVLNGDRQLGGRCSPELLAYCQREIVVNSLQENGEKAEVLEQEIRRQAYQFFIEEAEELLKVIDQGLDELIEEKTAAKVHEIMRAAHSIKGGAASVQLEEIRTIAYRLEKIFKALYYDEVIINEELYHLLKQGFAELKNLLESEIYHLEYNSQEALLTANYVFEAIEDYLGEAMNREDEYIPTSADLGIDIATSIFEIDVAQELDKLAEMIAHPQDYDLVQELRLSAEILGSFAEMLNLPEISNLVEAVNNALSVNPNEIYNIAQIALRDWSTAREQILSAQPILSPSEELIAYTQPTTVIYQETNGFTSSKSKLEQQLPPLLDDIFGASTETWTEATETETILSDTTSLDEIFGTTSEATELELLEPLENLSPYTEEQLSSQLENVASLEDVFGVTDNALEVNPPQSFDTPSLDDVFGELTSETYVKATQDGETPSLAELFTETTGISEIQDLDTPSLDEVFAQTTEIGETVLDTPSLDEVFAQTTEITEIRALDSLSLDKLFATTTKVRGNLNLETPSLDEVFAQNTEINEIENVTPSLDEVFAQTTEIGETGTIPSLDEVFSSLESKSETTAPIHPETSVNNLENLVKDVEKAFPSLPPATISSPENKITTATPKAKPPRSTKATTTTPRNPLSVRVDFNRLERMNNLVGELAINRNSLSLQNDQLQGRVKELLSRFARFQQITAKLREVSDLMLIDTSSRQEALQVKKTIDSRLESEITEDKSLQRSETAFDTLEMDRYGSLYSLAQTILEEMLQLEESVDDIVLFARGSNNTLQQQRQMLTNLRDELMWARMLPLGEVLNRFPRVLRDLSHNYHKPVNLRLVGTGVLVDRVALEKLYDPLLHLLRNAFDHGIENVETRRSLGKPEEGQITIRAYHQGNQTLIEMSDDGGGLNLEKIKQQAINSELATPQQLAVMSKEQITELIFEPGFSTAAKVSELSGRGVGLDVVRSQLRELKGNVTVSFEANKGTKFTLRLPLTLTIAKLLVCLINPQTNGVTAIAIPSDSIEEIIIPQSGQIKVSGEQRFLYWQRDIIPIYPLCDLLEYRTPVPEMFTSKALNPVATPEDWGLPLLLLRRGQQLFALEVNRLATEQELVIKPFNATVAAPSYSYGCTILGDGTIIPVINGITLLEHCLEPSTPTVTASISTSVQLSTEIPRTSTKPTVTQQTPTILVVDDSAALRRTLALTLEKSGYRVLQARDGREALQQLQQSSQIHLVICDVEMPNMNGFEFLGQRRRDPEMMKVPVAMLTSRSSEKHRQLATHLGASAYFTKPYIEQQFLTAIRNIISGE